MKVMKSKTKIRTNASGQVQEFTFCQCADCGATWRDGEPPCECGSDAPRPE